MFTLIWVPQRCKISSLNILIWRYPKPRLKKKGLDASSPMVYVVCHGGLLFSWLFLAAVKLHCPTSKKIIIHNLWCNGWMSVCSKMLGPSALQRYWSTKNLVFSFGYQRPFCSKSFVSGIFLKKKFFAHMGILVIRKCSSYNFFSLIKVTNLFTL